MDNIRNLIENKDYIQIKQEINTFNEHDIANILEELNKEEQVKIFRLLNKDLQADVFSSLETDTQMQLIDLLTDNEAINIINDMYSDDAADLFDEMSAIVVNRLLSKIDKEQRANINHLLQYADDSAGSIMSVEYLDLKENITIKDAISKIRKEYEEIESISTYFVTDKREKLIGTVLLTDLIIHDENIKIHEIMNEEVISVTTSTDQEEVARIIQEYDITSIPVVDSEYRLVGIITIDDIVDIIEEETTEDIEKMAAIVPTEKSYFKLSTIEIWKSRIPWLLLLMISATFTGKIIQHYELALSSYVILTSFIPMLMDTGGNAGGQASATIIRGISLNEIEFKELLKVVFKEFKVSILVGLTLAICNFIKLLLIDKVALTVALIVCITLLLTVIIAKLIGSSLPILAKKIGFDPAVMASPFITTIVDAFSLLIYFKIATSILGI